MPALFISLALLLVLCLSLLVEGAVQDFSLAKGWRIKQKFYYKKDQERNGEDQMNLKTDYSAAFGGGEVGYWQLKLDKVKRTQSLVVDIPVGEKDFLSYEIPVLPGMFQPSAISTPSTGTISFQSATSKKVIGEFELGMKRMKPILDSSFR